MIHLTHHLQQLLSGPFVSLGIMQAFERMYTARMPVWIQNLGLSMYGVYWKRMRLGGGFANYVEEFKARDDWSPEQMQDYVNGQLRRVLLHAYDSVPWYRTQWTAHGITRASLERMHADDLRQLPVTRKQDLRQSPGQFLAADVAGHQRLYQYKSSGSTGTPITVSITNEDHRRVTAAREARSFAWAGASLRMRRSMIGGRRVVPKAISAPPFYRKNWCEGQIYFSAFHISPDHVRDYVQGFNSFRPQVLTGYAYSHYVLARMMREQGLALDYEPVAAVLGSEKLTPDMKATIREAFRTRAYEEYGSVENSGLATECEHGSLHIHPDFGVLEIVDANGIPVEAGKEGRIVCTSLLKEAQPLIRYETGDMGILSGTRCPCGRDHLPVMKEIVGRLEDAVIGQDGREMVRLHGILLGLPGVVEGQIIQEDIGKFRVKVVTGEGFGERERHQIRHRFSVERLGPVEVTIEQVKEIPRTERGKFRAVVNRIPPDRLAELHATAAAAAVADHRHTR